MAHWSFEDIPAQAGKTAVVTGANAGIGFETARALANAGAHVVLACRSPERGQAALERLEGEERSGSVELMMLDLADLSSVRSFATKLTEQNERLDLLVNNAGVMVPPFSQTPEGFELQFAVNFLGHFALTGLLMEPLEKVAAARVVTLSSLAHRGGRIDFDNLAGEKKYRAWSAYQRSKLACLVFTLELGRRLAKAGSTIVSAAAHPGATKSDLQRHDGLMKFGADAFGMDTAKGALPTLYAATAPGVSGGDYYGPRGIYEMWGYPAAAHVHRRAKDEAVASKLWSLAEQATDVAFLS
jgi:NAD(P)-dependent dehydrogenase (short-subunit alcohol dehydrogenase family)